MTNKQRIVKYFAIILGISLILFIIGGILSFIFIMGNKYKSDKPFNKDFNNISYLEIDLKDANVIFKKGNKLNIDSNKDVFKIKNKDGKLEVEDSSVYVKDNKNITITIPDNISVELELKSGDIDINDVLLNSLDIDFKVGSLNINDCTINNMSIDNNTGEVKITNSSLSNLDIDNGVGNIYVNGVIKGLSNIDAGVGDITLDLMDNDYIFNVRKGLGDISLNNELLKNGSYNKGLNKINIEGGVGNIVITTKKD